MPKPLIMGIVNVTPDSFSDGGQFFSSDSAIAHGLKLLEEGADILDIGGESTRPGATPISTDEEISRIIPVIRELSKTGKLISVDTRNLETMRAAVAAGAGFINDIEALSRPGSIEIVEKSGASVCLMHMQGEPQTMQENPTYKNVVEEVFSFLETRVQTCVTSGISKEKIHADIGIGFGKSAEHNMTLLKNVNKFKGLGVKLLIGASRKKFIETIAGPSPDRLGGSLAVALWACQNEIDIVRVHDVAETRQAFVLWSDLSGNKR